MQKARTAARLIILAALVVFVSCRVDHPGKILTKTVELRSNEAELYPQYEDVAVESLERTAQGVGLSLIFRSDVKDFRYFLYSVNGSGRQKSESGAVQIMFDDNRRPESQRREIRIRAGNSADNMSREYGMSIGYYPKELYAKSGQKAPGYVIIQKCDIPFVSSRVEDWIVDKPDPDDSKFAEKTWGAYLEGRNSPLERAQALARALVDELNPHRGIPSDLMKTTPFEQYRRAVSGRDHVWCENLARIFVRAANALGIPARMIDMSRIWSQGEKFELRTAEGHATTEIFDETLNRWIWLDLTFGLLGMILEGYGLIDMAELHRSLNDPGKIVKLIGIEYDPASKTERLVSVSMSDKTNSLLNYFKKDQTFRYTRRLR